MFNPFRYLLAFSAAALLAACAPAPTPAPTAAPSPSPVPPTPTRIPSPTATPAPSATPTPRATEVSVFPPVRADEWQKGPATARLTIIEYADYQ